MTIIGIMEQLGRVISLAAHRVLSVCLYSFFWLSLVSEGRNKKKLQLLYNLSPVVVYRTTSAAAAAFACACTSAIFYTFSDPMFYSDVSQITLPLFVPPPPSKCRRRDGGRVFLLCFLPLEQPQARRARPQGWLRRGLIGEVVRGHGQILRA